MQLVDDIVQHGRVAGQHRDRLPLARHLRRPRPLRLRHLPTLQVIHSPVSHVYLENASVIHKHVIWKGYYIHV